MRKNHILFTATFIMATTIFGIGFGLIFLLSDRFSFGAGTIGLFLALGYGSYMAGCEFFRRVGERIDIRFCIPLATLTMTIAALTIWFSPSPILTAAAWAVLQWTTAFYWPPLMGWITRGLEGEKLNKDLGRFNQAWSIGALLGPVISGILYSQGPMFAFFMYIASFGGLTLFLAASTLINREMRQTRTERKTGPSRMEKAPAAGDSTALEETGSPLRFPSWVGIFTAYAFLGVVINIIPLEIRNGLGFSEQTAGNLLFIRGIASLLGFTLLGKTVKWHFNRRWLVITQGIIIFLPLILLSGEGSLVPYILTLTLFGLIFTAAYNNSIFHGCAMVTNRGGRMAVHEGVLTAGAAFGSYIGGLVYQHAGVPGAVFFLSLLSLTGFMVSSGMILRRKGRRTS